MSGSLYQFEGCFAFRLLVSDFLIIDLNHRKISYMFCPFQLSTHWIQLK